MNLRTINISANPNHPVHVLMDTKAPKHTERAYKSSEKTQQRVNEFIIGLNLINQWADEYKTTHTILIDEDAPTTLAGLKKQMAEEGNISISPVGSDNTVFKPSTILCLRHRYDRQHIEFNKGMSKEDELFLADQLAQQVTYDILMMFNLLQKDDNGALQFLLYNIIYTDFAKQTEYYDHHKRFVDNQKLFTQTCLFNTSELFRFAQV